jgi:hypothetical protein
MTKGFLPQIFRKVRPGDLTELENNLIRQEASITKNIFGPAPKGHYREFFCLDQNTWVWHDEWDDQSGNRVIVSTKYFIRTEGALKSINGGAYSPIDKDETKNLYHAIKQYANLVLKEYDKIKK